MILILLMFPQSGNQSVLRQNPTTFPSLLRSQVDELYQASEDDTSQVSSAVNPRKGQSNI